MPKAGAAAPDETPLHRRDPRVKALALAGVLLAIGKGFTAPSFLLIAAVVVSGMAFSRYPPRRLLGQVPVLLSLVAVSLLMNALFVTGEPAFSIGPVHLSRIGFVVGAAYAAKLVLAVLATGVFLHATPPLDLIDALGEPRMLPRRLRAGWRQTALLLALALRFLPTMRDETRRIREGQRSRGAAARGGPLARVRDLVTLVVPLVLWTVSRAREVSYLLDARGFDASRARTSVAARRLRMPDALPVLVPAALYAAVRRIG